MVNLSRIEFSFGCGLSIVPEDDDLLVTAVHVRFRKICVLGELRISSYRSRPADEWAQQYKQFLRKFNLGHLAVTVVLPRSWSTIRVIRFPELNRRDLTSAIRLQVDSLHPYREDGFVYAWRRLPSSHHILIGIADKGEFDALLATLQTAGIAIARATVSAAAIHSAIRFGGRSVPSVFAAVERRGSQVEVYAETSARPLYSVAVKHASPNFEELVRSELRLDSGSELAPLKHMLPDYAGDSSSAIGLAAAIDSASLLSSATLNLLPKQERASNSRLIYLPTAVLAGLLLLVVLAHRVQDAMDKRRYQIQIADLLAQVEPRAREAQKLDRQSRLAAAGVTEIDRFRNQSRSDLQALNELSSVLAEPVYLTTFDLNHASVVIAGHAKSAAGLLKQIDASGQFQNSTFIGDIAPGPDGESFRLKAERRSGQ